jgi:uncharacterized protein YbjT (DUF2867 family)
MKILVAGGTGLLGSAIVAALKDAGFETGILSRSQPKGDGVTWVQADVIASSDLEAKLRGWDVVVDAVQVPNYPMENKRKGLTFERVDYGGTVNLVDAAKAAGVGHFIGLSGAGAAEESPYHWIRFKWKEEQHIVQSGVPYTVFRPSWVYAPNDVSLNRFLGFARWLPFIPIIGNGKTRVAPVFIDDVAAHVRGAVERGPQNAIFEIGGPQVLTMDEIVKTALRVSGKRRLLLHHPVWMMKIVASVAQFLPGPPLTPDAIDFVVQDGLADTGPLQKTFGLRLTPLEEALSTYLTR